MLFHNFPYVAYYIVSFMFLLITAIVNFDYYYIDVYKRQVVMLTLKNAKKEECSVVVFSVYRIHNNKKIWYGEP